MFKVNNGLQLYNLDYDAFHQDIEQLKKNQFEVDMDKSNDRYLEGTVNIDEGQLLFTTIPYEKGWTLTVDGKKADDLITEIKNEETGTISYKNDFDAETGKVIMLESTIGLKLPAGEHTITMKYTPPGFTLGMFTLVLGIGIMIIFYRYDKKNNQVLIALQKEKERKKQGLSPEDTNESSEKKNVQIIKSKGAVSEQELVQKTSDEENETETVTEDSENDTPETPDFESSSDNKNKKKK